MLFLQKSTKKRLLIWRRAGGLGGGGRLDQVSSLCGVVVEDVGRVAVEHGEEHAVAALGSLDGHGGDDGDGESGEGEVAVVGQEILQGVVADALFAQRLDVEG